MLNTSNMWDMYQKKSDSENFFKTLGVGDLWVPSVLDFAGESPLTVLPEARAVPDLTMGSRRWS